MSNANLKVLCGAGHGGSNSTPGKRTPDGEYEWNFNDIMVRGFMDELRKYDKVELRRVDDASGKKDVALESRTAVANSWGADYYFDFHNNALAGKWGSHGGTEVFYGAPSGAKQLLAESKVVAQLTQNALVGVLGLRNRGIKDGSQYWILRKSLKTVTVLPEGGFMDSTTDIKVLRDKKKMEEAGRAVARAFAAYKKLKLKNTSPIPTPTPSTPQPKTTSVMYRVRESWANAASQKGAFTNLANAKELADKHPGYEVYDQNGKVVYTPIPPNPYKGKKLTSKVNGLRYYSKPSWDTKDVVGYLSKGIGFPTILDKIQVGTSTQYKVQNSKGQIFYVTASTSYVQIT